MIACFHAVFGTYVVLWFLKSSCDRAFFCFFVNFSDGNWRQAEA